MPARFRAGLNDYFHPGGNNNDVLESDEMKMRDIGEMLFMAAMAWALVVFAIEALSYERFGDCTVCLWERVK